MSLILRLETDDEPVIGDPIVANILRFNPSSDNEPQFQRYVIPYRHRMSVFTILREIYEHQDPTLAFRNQQCGRGICGNCHCLVEINGQKQKLVKGCSIPLKPGDRLVIYPKSQEKLIRDLVTTF
jgi:succinate dehydrogenase/fumarate reductase-like Fe-S protein